MLRYLNHAICLTVTQEDLIPSNLLVHESATTPLLNSLSISLRLSLSQTWFPNVNMIYFLYSPRASKSSSIQVNLPSMQIMPHLFFNHLARSSNLVPGPPHLCHDTSRLD